MKNLDPKYRLTNEEIGLLSEALFTSARHYAMLSQEAHVLGDPILGQALAEKSREFLSLANQGQGVNRVTVRFASDLPF